MQTTMLDFKPLNLSDRARLNDALRRVPPEVSEHTFTNLYVWRELLPVLLAEAEGSLVLVQERHGDRSVLGPPIGEAGPAHLLPLLEGSGIERFERLPASAAEPLREAGWEVAADRDNADDVYLRRDLAELEGRQYHGKKNMVNQCLSAYGCDYARITADVVGEVADMQDRWCAERDCGRDPGLCAEYRDIRETLTRFAEFGLIGGLVRIGGSVQAYSIGEALNPDTAVVHFEKAMTEFRGLYQVINQWFCKHALTEFEFVNREQDLGIPGLRRAKESYQPHRMVEKFVAAAEAELAAQAVGGDTEGRCTE